MKKSDIFLLIFLSMLWGTSSLLVRIVAPIIGISLSVGSRMLVAALAMMLVTGLMGRFPDFKKRWKAYLFLGAFNIIIPFALATYTIMQLNASISSLLGATIPLFTVVAARYWMKEKITFNKIAGILVSITGLAIFIGSDPIVSGTNFWLAILAGLSGSFSYAVSSVYVNLKFTCSNPAQTAGGQIVAASIIILPFLLANFQPVLFTPGIIFPLLILAILNTAGGYILYFKLLSSAGSVQASFVTILLPVFSVLWASIFLHEKITSIMLMGLAFVVSGIFMVVYKKASRQNEMVLSVK